MGNIKTLGGSEEHYKPVSSYISFQNTVMFLLQNGWYTSLLSMKRLSYFTINRAVRIQFHWVHYTANEL